MNMRIAVIFFLRMTALYSLYMSTGKSVKKYNRRFIKIWQFVKEFSETFYQNLAIFSYFNVTASETLNFLMKFQRL